MGSAYSLPLARVNVEPLGVKDGVNLTFTLPNSDSCNPASLIVYLNGQAVRPDSVTCVSPFKIFVLDPALAPVLVDSSDALTCSYSVLTP